MIRNIYAIFDAVSGFADQFEIVSDTPARYVAQVNRVNRMKPVPALMAKDLKIYHLGTINDEDMKVVKFDQPVLIGDFKESLEWLERMRADAQSNPRPC